MKKTTKILLVLAAVVAMTIGAVSTVMAADEFPTISEWVEVKNVGWQAKDANGETIVRGWAQKDGFWYFFDSSYMLVNTFITWNEEIYYLDGNGHMAIGWIGFDNDTTTSNKAKYDTIINTVDKYEKESYAYIGDIDAADFNGVFKIATADAISKPLDLPKGDYELLWCYFKEDGTMAHNEWYNAWGLWYFSYGAYAVLGDYQVAIELNNSPVDDLKKFLAEDGEGFYGFAADGHMLVFWEKYVEINQKFQDGALTDDDTPYEDKGADKAEKSTAYWTYYHADGRQVNTTPVDPKKPNTNKYNADIYEGWEFIGDNWTYFIQDEVLGMVLLQNDFVYDDYTDDGGKLEPNDNKGTFYVDANGYLVRGLKTFAKDATIGTWDEANTTASAIKFAAAAATFKFAESTGQMLYGIQDRYYFLTRDGEADYVYEVRQTGDNGNVAKVGASTFDMVAFTKVKEGTTNATTYIEGQRLDGKNYFVVVDEAVLDIKWNADDDKTDRFIYYFESGKMQKNQAIKFGSVTIAIDANGCVVTAATNNKVTVAGHTFELAGAADNQIILANGNEQVIIPGLKK